MKKPILSSATTLLAAWLACGAAVGGAAGELMPAVHWDSELRVVFASPPAAVVAWLEGAVDDPDGTLGELAAAYERQRRSAGFGAAMLELQEIVRTEADRTGAGAAEVELGLIPRILHARDDLRAALLGADPLYPSNPGSCWEEFAGKISCVEWWGFFCYKVGCRLDTANTCSIFMPCKGGSSPAGAGGLDPVSNFH